MRLVRIMCELLRALECCHGAGIIHRDLKPSNVLLDGQHTAKLSDFGAAALVQGAWEAGIEAGASSVVFIGTPQYSCPEAWSGAPPEAHWDLYALGMIAREALTGSPGIRAGSPLEYIAQASREALPLISKMGLAISPAFAALVDRLTAWSPTDRYDSAREVLEALMATPEFNTLQGLQKETIEESIRFVPPRPGKERKDLRAPFRLPFRPSGLFSVVVLALLLVVIGLQIYWTPPAFSKRPADLVAMEGQSEDLAPRDAYAWYSAHSPSRRGWLQLRPGSGGKTEGLGVIGSKILRFQIERGRGDGASPLSGVWASYVDSAGIAPRYGYMSGSLAAAGSVDGMDAYSFSFLSETDPAHWQETFFVGAAPLAASAQTLLLDLGSDPRWMGLVFRELLPRDIEDRFRLAPFFPVFGGNYLYAQRIESNARPQIDGQINEAFWELEGTASGAAVVSPQGVGLALRSPWAGTMPRLELALQSASLQGDGYNSWDKIVVSSAALDGPQGVEAAFHAEDGWLHAELWFPVPPGQESQWPQRDTAFRLAASLLDEHTGATVAQWGAATAEGSEEAMLVVLNRARLELP